MIQKEYNYFILVCDNCLYDEPTHFKTFQEACAFKRDKSNGWRSQLTPDNKWEDNCPECVKIMYGGSNLAPSSTGDDVKCHNQNVHRFKDIVL